MSRPAILVSLLILALLGGAGYWISQQLEKKEIELPTGLTGEAAVNPLLAGERFLTAMGITTTPLDDSSRLLRKLGSTDVLLISSDRQTLGLQRTAALLEWVERGGRLIVTVPHLLDEEEPLRDPLLETLDLTLFYVDEDVSEYADYLDVDWPSADDFMKIDIELRYVLEGVQSGDWVIENDWGAVLVRRQHGYGTVTIVTDLEFIQFLRIGEHDHARFLWHLVDGQGPVWLITNNDMPSLWDWLWQHAPEIMTAGLLWLGLWLWSRSRRFGPRLAELPPVRRRILEHVEANGRFLWHQKQSHHLLAAVRKHFITTAATRYPGWERMTDEERAELLASVTDQDVRTTRRLLAEPEIRHQHEFTRKIRQYENIRKQL
ncbi:MAG: DUF4350 domain-containing protein [Halobacteria archaeon]|nr:DUF4350 domain-containing protein [Halobacteria archaeon]